MLVLLTYIVLYDQFHDRFILTQFTDDCKDAKGGICYSCIAASETPDPTGSYHLYKVPAQKDVVLNEALNVTDGTVFPDYPKVCHFFLFVSTQKAQ